MMHRRGESDSAIVAGKPTNKVERSAAEPVEPRAEAKGNARQQSTDRTQSRGTVSQALERIRQAARQRKKEKFTALLHHISIDLLDEAFFELRKDAAPGVDGLIWTDYEQNLERNLEDLHARIHRGAYRALPSRRTYIPKPDGRQRPLAIAALEDKIVQRATVAVQRYRSCPRRLRGRRRLEGVYDVLKKDGFNVSPVRKSASAPLSWQALKIKRGQRRL
jgi:RNA-directed DNA polymerase